MALASRRLVYFTAGFALFVIVVGAYVRLEDAGLGCPDWPGCYGQIVGVPDQAHEIERASAVFRKTVDVGRARKEMFHRYLAGTLGLLIATIAVMAWRGRQRLRQSPLLASAPAIAAPAPPSRYHFILLPPPLVATVSTGLAGAAIGVSDTVTVSDASARTVTVLRFSRYPAF